MRRIRYGVAMSLDGYIAGPDGELPTGSCTTLTSTSPRCSRSSTR